MAFNLSTLSIGLGLLVAAVNLYGLLKPSEFKNVLRIPFRLRSAQARSFHPFHWRRSGLLHLYQGLPCSARAGGFDAATGQINGRYRTLGGQRVEVGHSGVGLHISGGGNVVYRFALASARPALLGHGQ